MVSTANDIRSLDYSVDSDGYVKIGNYPPVSPERIFRVVDGSLGKQVRDWNKNHKNDPLVLGRFCIPGFLGAVDRLMRSDNCDIEEYVLRAVIIAFNSLYHGGPYSDNGKHSIRRHLEKLA